MAYLTINNIKITGMAACVPKRVEENADGARKLFAPDGTLVAELAAAGADGVRKYRNAIYGYEYEIREI